MPPLIISWAVQNPIREGSIPPLQKVAANRRGGIDASLQALPDAAPRLRQSDAPNHLVRGVFHYSSVFSVPSVMAGVSSGASRDFFSALT